MSDFGCPEPAGIFGICFFRVQGPPTDIQPYKGVTGIEGHCRQSGLTQQFRGREYTIEMIPKLKIEIAAKDGGVNGLVKTIADAARTGETGGGKIFVSLAPASTASVQRKKTKALYEYGGSDVR